MMEDFIITVTSDGGSYPWQRVGRFEIRLSWKFCPPAVGRRVPLSTFCSKQRAKLRHPKHGGRYRKLPCTSRTARRARAARAPHPRTYPGQSGSFGGLWSVRGRLAEPRGVSNGWAQKGHAAQVIHNPCSVQGSLGICRLRKGGRECAYLSRIDRNRSNRFEDFLAGACGWLQTSAGMNAQLQTSECGPSVCRFTARS